MPRTWRRTLLLLLTLCAPGMVPATPVEPPVPLPEFTRTDQAAWLNSPPLRRADLAGQVVLVDVWTFECWNCYRSFPWLTALEKQLAGSPFRVVGIHSPEFAREREPARVRAKIAEFGLHHPVMLDNDFAYWNALGNRYWPAFYLVDRQGRIRHTFVGEVHAGDRQARAMEAAIRELLAEPP